jgi:hypothetical protein
VLTSEERADIQHELARVLAAKANPQAYIQVIFPDSADSEAILGAPMWAGDPTTLASFVLRHCLRIGWARDPAVSPLQVLLDYLITDEGIVRFEQILKRVQDHIDPNPSAHDASWNEHTISTDAIVYGRPPEGAPGAEPNGQPVASRRAAQPTDSTPAGAQGDPGTVAGPVHRVKQILSGQYAVAILGGIIATVVGGVVVALLLSAFTGSPSGNKAHGTGNSTSRPTLPSSTPLPISDLKTVAVLADPHSRGVRSVAFSFDHKYLVAADANGNAYVWATPANTIANTLTARTSQGVNAAAFSKDGKLATGDANGHIYLWSGAHYYEQLADPSSKGVTTVAFTPNSQYLAAGDANGRTYIWNLATHRTVAVLADPQSLGVRSVAFTPNGQFLAIGDANGRAYIRDVSNTGA